MRRIALNSPRVREFLYYWLPPLVWCAAILALSGDWGSAKNTLGLVKWLLSWIPGLTLGQIYLIHGYLRKLGHLTAYGLLFFFWFRAFRGHFQPAPRWSPLWSLALCLAVACLDEGHQAFFQSRTGSPRDVVLDMTGAGISALIILAIWRRRGKPAAPTG